MSLFFGIFRDSYMLQISYAHAWFDIGSPVATIAVKGGGIDCRSFGSTAGYAYSFFGCL